MRGFLLAMVFDGSQIHNSYKYTNNSYYEKFESIHKQGLFQKQGE